MVRVAAEKGLETATVADVVAMARVSETDFYEMFESKQACFLEAYDAVVDALIAHMSTAYETAAEEPWPQRIVAVLRAMMEFLVAEAAVARMAMVEVSAAGGAARAKYRAALARFTPFLDEGRIYSGQGDSLPPDTARFAVGGATAMIFDEFRAGRGPELERILPQLAFAVLMPYLGPADAEKEMGKVARQRLSEA
jgi:AcrR family transcriptional regulator